ncbi:TPA: pseudaminic acid cytidylyltransferase [Citrobacter koseri]|uniref:pseudaminic acid cytidylyltransferase n=1 Tax=Citrobacter TaxID=544 RepID=UPI000DFE341E|nr:MULTISPECIES: pseudaminic acid cytidylyltransferase [Citrobacter]MCE5348646.1 pseudaminic acid cytidylyltransferase [Citrobacter koseri]MDE9577641.1 pseudaminic acid cytidylyltransferase [Citrobacter koseri]MDM2974576.1 pseudaminic acid cytidylyltransferase [Citrobacter sp. CK198]MDM2996524.1 pseudaminic acid cytidylyltransferase [Citrobacter sp. CK195]MDM3026828.1 pseudaminic acid cytidylyltransferase [Citrobacter sp. CK194]
MNVAIIPARGGSKRIPRKNIKEFCGKPMIAWSIEAAQQSGVFDRIIVSTDDEEIAEVARKYGAEVPFMRPAHISDDFATTVDVIHHALDELSQSVCIDFVCCIYATAPFLQGQDLEKAYEKLQQSDCDYVFSATSFPFPIQRAVYLKPDGKVQMFHPENEKTRSQDLEPAYHDAGQFYWGKPEAFMNRKGFFTSKSLLEILPRERVQDIDTPEDWVIAENLFQLLKAKIDG